MVSLHLFGESLKSLLVNPAFPFRLRKGGVNLRDNQYQNHRQSNLLNYFGILHGNYLPSFQQKKGGGIPPPLVKGINR
jgi:hypothetical protein